MISALNRLPDGSIELTITIPWEKVNQTYQKTLTDLAKKTTVNGFRKGKAPLGKVEQQVGKAAIYEQVVRALIPEVYLEAIKEHKLSPILAPQTQLISAEEKKDWQVKVITCELPKVKLDEYEKAVKTALAGEKIWTPDKAGQKSDTAELETQCLEKIFKALLKTVNVSLPKILVEDEVNRRLSRLIDQTAKLGLTVEQYLTSTGKTTEEIRTEYRRQAEETLKLELILSAIADQKKITISDSEVEKMIQSLPGQEKEKIDTPTQRAYIRQLLRKRQVIDNLLKL